MVGRKRDRVTGDRDVGGRVELLARGNHGSGIGQRGWIHEPRNNAHLPATNDRGIFDHRRDTACLVRVGSGWLAGAGDQSVVHRDDIWVERIDRATDVVVGEHGANRLAVRRICGRHSEHRHRRRLCRNDPHIACRPDRRGTDVGIDRVSDGVDRKRSGASISLATAVGCDTSRRRDIDHERRRRSHNGDAGRVGRDV